MWIWIYLLLGILVVSFGILWNEWLAKRINPAYIRREWQDLIVAIFGIIVTVILWFPIVAISVMFHLERYLYARRLLRGKEKEHR